MTDHIDIDPEVCEGRPIVRGTDIPLHDILTALSEDGEAHRKVAERFGIEECLIHPVLAELALMFNEPCSPVERIDQ